MLSVPAFKINHNLLTGVFYSISIAGHMLLLATFSYCPQKECEVEYILWKYILIRSGMCVLCTKNGLVNIRSYY